MHKEQSVKTNKTKATKKRTNQNKQTNTQKTQTKTNLKPDVVWHKVGLFEKRILKIVSSSLKAAAIRKKLISTQHA